MGYRNSHCITSCSTCHCAKCKCVFIFTKVHMSHFLPRKTLIIGNIAPERLIYVLILLHYAFLASS